MPAATKIKARPTPARPPARNVARPGGWVATHKGVVAVGALAGVAVVVYARRRASSATPSADSSATTLVPGGDPYANSRGNYAGTAAVIARPGATLPTTPATPTTNPGPPMCLLPEGCRAPGTVGTPGWSPFKGIPFADLTKQLAQLNYDQAAKLATPQNIANSFYFTQQMANIPNLAGVVGR